METQPLYDVSDAYQKKLHALWKEQGRSPLWIRFRPNPWAWKRQKLRLLLPLGIAFAGLAIGFARAQRKRRPFRLRA